MALNSYFDFAENDDALIYIIRYKDIHHQK